MFECACVDFDVEAEFFSEKIVKARKHHKCVECGKGINPGERYETATGKWDGDIHTNKTCMICRAIRNDHMSCGWIYGELWRTLTDIWGEDAYLLGI